MKSARHQSGVSQACWLNAIQIVDQISKPLNVNRFRDMAIIPSFKGRFTIGRLPKADRTRTTDVGCALNAFVNLVAQRKPPTRLHDYWLSIAKGLSIGKMDSLTFLLYDQADGSRGAIPLDKQRLEHLEMWTLLGDPALKIPYLESTLEVDVKAEIGSSEVVIEFDVPGTLIGDACELQVQFYPRTGAQISQPIVSTQQLEAKPRYTATIPGFQPLSSR